MVHDAPTIKPDARLKTQEPVLALLSHEMRTPLNGVLGMAGLLAATKLDATQQAYLSALRDSGELLLSLVNDILDLAKLDSRPLELEPVDLDVERLLQGVCELLSPRAHAAGIEIAWSTRGLLPRLRADDGRLRQILFNLAGNAIKLTEAGGVLVTAAQVGGAKPGEEPARIRVRFSVKDTGPGVAPDFQTKIFEAFVQTEAGVRAGGAGLGLAIVKRLAAAFEGELGLISPPGEGAEFWFEADFALADGEPAAAPSLRGRRVAVVSANPIVRTAAAMQIKTCGGEVVEARLPASPNGPDALLPVAFLPVAFLIDADPKAAPPPLPSNAPSIVLLAPEDRSRIEAFRAAGYAGYLIKPLRRASLAARVLAVVDEAGAAPAAIEGAATPVDDERADDERATDHSAKGLRVLLAEDNPINALLARALLTRAGCTVDRAATGEEALTALEQAPYDLVLMDMRMPGMDGLSAARELRRRGDRTPIIALTANAFEDDRRACLASGMDDFLTKPLEPKALQAALARWTQRSGMAERH